MGRACSTYGRNEKCKQNLVRKPEEKRSLRRSSCKCAVWVPNLVSHFGGGT